MPVTELSAVAGVDFPDEWYEITADGHFWLEWRFRAFLGQLRDLRISLQVPWRGLDVGCGHGAVRRQIEASSAWITDGADLHREALRQNEPRRGETFFYNIHDRHPRLAEHYDFALLFDILEHVEDPQRFLESTLYHLKPHGWLFVNVPALDSMRSSYDRAVGHLRRYSKRTLRAEMERSGVELRDLRYWGFSMLPYLGMRKFMGRREPTVRRVIERGVTPPAPWMNHWIVWIMKLETAWLKRPILGTSLLTAAVKSPRGGVE